MFEVSTPSFNMCMVMSPVNCSHASAQDMLESLAEWFYATEYISSVPLAFRHPRRQISVVYSN